MFPLSVAVGATTHFHADHPIPRRNHPFSNQVQREGRSALKALIPEKLTHKDERKRRLETGRVTTLFHQTDAAAAAAIVASQKFMRGASGSAGGGIYFATSVEATARKAMSHGPVLQADVCLGNVKHISGTDQHITFTHLRDEGFDSVKTTIFQSGTEYVFAAACCSSDLYTRSRFIVNYNAVINC